MARATRRVLHRLNLPAGTDVSRILNEIGQLRVQVRELSNELDEARAELAARRPRGPVSTIAAQGPPREAGGEEGGGGLMVAMLSPAELVERVRKDAERNVLRVRNGLKHLAGVGRPELTQTPKETVWSAEKVELWRYPQRPRTIRHAAAVRAQPRVAQLRVRPRARQQLRRVRCSSAASTCTSSTGACPTSSRAATRSRPTPTTTSRRSSREVPRLSGAPTSTLFGVLLRRRPVAAVRRRPPRRCRCRSLAVMATPIDFHAHGPDDVDDAGGPRRARATCSTRTGQRAGRRDAQLVPGAAAARPTSPATSTCGSTSGTTTSSPPTRR